MLDLEAQLDALRGEVDLKIPAASAVKIGGERAYKLHRRGVAVEMPMRRTTVYELELEEYEEPIAQLSMRLSSGGYVRALAEALGGHCVSLRRTERGAVRRRGRGPGADRRPRTTLSPRFHEGRPRHRPSSAPGRGRWRSEPSTEFISDTAE